MSTREEWLQKAITLCTAHRFHKHGYKVPKLKVSVGLPYGRGAKKAIGEHWHPNSSADKTGSIFISPTIDDSEQVLGCLVHEMVHGVVGNENKHNAKFRKCALAVGLEGKMTSTNPGDELCLYFKKVIIKKIGKYPHVRLDIGDRPTKKQTTRLIRLECDECGFICRAALTKILEVGAPLCACNHEPMSVELPEDEDGGDE